MTFNDRNSIPPMPAVGESVSLHGGAITRTDEARFTVHRKDGRDWHTVSTIKSAVVGFSSGINRLRRDADLAPLKLPCAYCGVRPRWGIGHNIYCSVECRNAASNKAPQTAATKPVGRPRKIDTLSCADAAFVRYIERPGKSAPDYHQWVKDADALILRLDGTLPEILDQYVSKAWTEREETA